MVFKLSDIELIRQSFSLDNFKEAKTFNEAQGFMTHALLCDIWEMLYLLLYRNKQGNDRQDSGE